MRVTAKNPRMMIGRMQCRENRAATQLEFEPEPQVRHDEDEGEQHRQVTLLAQLLAHLWTDDIDTAQFDARIHALERLDDARADDVATHALVRFETDHDVTRGAEILCLRLRESGCRDGVP